MKNLSILLMTATCLLALLLLANQIGPEHWWLTALLLYLPRWAWLFPGGGLLLVSLVLSRRDVWGPILGLLLAAGPAIPSST